MTGSAGADTVIADLTVQLTLLLTTVRHPVQIQLLTLIERRNR